MSQARPDPRRKARQVVLQSLYETDLSGHDPRAALERLIDEEGLADRLGAFSRMLLEGVLTNRGAIDRLIEATAPAWPAEQLAAVDRNILRLAIREFFIDNLTPVSAAINEAVELAKKYGSESSPKFVNGVLGSVSAIANDSAPTQEGE